LSGIRAILYDLDGVLVDACDWHYEALNKALMKICGFKLSPREHEAKFNGLPTASKLELLHTQGRVSPTDFTEINSLKQRYTMEILEGLTKNQGKIELHERVTELNIKIACVTNSIRQSAETMLRNTGQLDYMKFIVSNQDIEHPKPCAEGYIVAMVCLGALPKETLIVEDSPKGIEAAKSTGAPVLEVANAAEVTWERIRTIIQE
jgi:beta-phosphoglucomutase